MARWIALLLLVACKAEPATQAQPTPAPPPIEKPMRVSFGDCAAPDVELVVGAPPPREHSPPAPPGALGHLCRSCCIGAKCGYEGSGQSSIANIPCCETKGAGTIRGYGISGGGSTNRPRVDPPKASINSADVIGELDAAIVRRYVRRHMAHITYCYEKQLIAAPGLAGELRMSWNITAAGTAQDVTAEGFHTMVGSCVADLIGNTEFPKPKTGTVAATYTFKFDPAGTATAAKPPAAATFPNPLRDHERELAACLRAEATPYGALLVDFAFDSSGKVTNSVVHGLSDGTCVAKVANAIKAMEPNAAARRCPITYGEMPFERLPALELADNALIWNGQRVAETAAFSGDRIQMLYDELVAHVRSTAGSALAKHGPILFRPDSVTPMRIVNAVINSAHASEVEVVLAAPHAFGGGRPLRVTQLPEVPRPRNGNSIPADPTRPSLLVARNGVSIEDSAGSEKIAGRAWQQVVTKLTEVRTRNASRRDLEIRVDPNLTYEDLVHAADAARDAGFTDWRLFTK